MKWVGEMLIIGKEVKAGFLAVLDPGSLGKALQLECSLGAVLIYIHGQPLFPT